MHLNALAHQFRFEKVFDSSRKQDVKNNKKDAGPQSSLQNQIERRRQENGPDPYNRQKCEQGHDHPPQKRRFETEERKNNSAKSSLD